MWKFSFARAAVVMAVMLGLWGLGSNNAVVAQALPKAGIVKCGGKSGCPSGQWCEPPTGTCSTKKRTGTCEYVPVVCTFELGKVCGCDGKTYNNDCLRRQAQVGKKKSGECRPLVIKGNTPSKDTIKK